MQFLKKLSVYDWAVVLLIVTGAFLRFYNLEDSQQFLGDQGRDAMVVSRIFKEADPVFIGPVTSVGNMYLGPLYYYFMMPLLWLSYPSPMGPIYGVAILSIVAIAATYLVGKRMFSPLVGMLAAAGMTFSSVVVTHSRFSWNPNPAPLFSVLMVYFTYLAWRKNEKYWLLVALMLAVLMQLHYVNLLMAVGAGFVWLLSFGEKWRKKNLRNLLMNTFLAVVIILVSMLPLILFDLKHDGLNAKAFMNIFTGERSFQAGKASSIFGKAISVAAEFRRRASLLLLDSHFGRGQLTKISLVGIAVGSAAWLHWVREKSTQSLADKNKLAAAVVIIIYVLVSIVGLTFYKHDIYDHYILFIFPIVFLLFAGLVGFAFEKKQHLGWLVLGLFAGAFFHYNLNELNFKDAGWQLSDISRTAKTIAERVEPGEKYNIVLLSETRDLYGQNYRYFLTTYSEKEPINPEREVEVDTLFIINEERKVEDPTELPIYQIEIFPNKNPEEIYQVEDGPEITVLRSTPEEQPEDN